MIIYVGLIIMLLMFPSQLAMTLTKWSKKPKRVKKTYKDKDGNKHSKIVSVRPKLKVDEVIKCCLPYGSAMMSWKAMYHTCGWTTITSIISLVVIVARVAIVFLTQSTLLWVVSFWAFWAALLLFHVTYAVTFVVVAYLYSANWVTIIATAIFPYGMAWILCNNVPRFMNMAAKEEDDIFKG